MSIKSFIVAIIQLQECADRLAAETLAVVEHSRALRNEQTPMFGRPPLGPITPRRVDNAERSGANLFKRVNAVYFRVIKSLNRQAPGATHPRNTTKIASGAFFAHLPPRSAHKPAHSVHFTPTFCTFGNSLFSA